MTYHDVAPSGSNAGPGWPDLDTLADFHADALDPQTAERVAAHVRTDPEAQRVLAALDATVTDLRSLPAVTVPPFVARRIDNALATEAGRTSTVRDLVDRSQPPAGPRPLTAPTPYAAPIPTPAAPVTHLDEARTRRLRRTRLLSAVAAGVIVVGGGAFAVSQSGSPTSDVAGGNPPAASEPAVQAPTYDERSISTAAGDVLTVGKIEDGKAPTDVAGQMATVFERNKCLLLLRGSVTPPPMDNPLAVQQITYEGQSAYAFVFPGDSPDQVRLVVVSTDSCGTVLQDIQTEA